MPKQKTKKAASKRFSVSSKGNVRHRATKQAHFNARADGNETRRKHTDRSISQSDEKRVRGLIPYAQ